jgi:hypothetical protein
MKLKLPPFGHRVVKSIQDGYTNDIYLFCGINAWKKAKAFDVSRPTLCLPPWLDPLQFNWPVQNTDVLIFDTSGADDDYLNDIAYALSTSHARTIRCVTHEFNLIRFE